MLRTRSARSAAVLGRGTSLGGVDLLGHAAIIANTRKVLLAGDQDLGSQGLPVWNGSGLEACIQVCPDFLRLVGRERWNNTGDSKERSACWRLGRMHGDVNVQPSDLASGVVDDDVLKLRLPVRRRHYAHAGHFDESGCRMFFHNRDGAGRAGSLA